MMTFYYILLHLAGLILFLPFRRNLPIWFIATTGFVWGLVIWVLSSIFALLLGIDYSWMSITLITLPLLGIAIYVSVKNGTYKLDRKSWMILAASVIGFSFLAYLVTRMSLVVASTDSFSYIFHGRVMATSGLVPWSINALTGYGVFISIIQMASDFLPGEFVNGFQIILGMILLATLFFSIIAALKDTFTRIISILIAGALVLVLGSKMFQFHLFFIHSNLTASVLLFLSLYSFWNLIKDDEGTWITPGVLSLIGFSLTRIEGPIFSVIILLIIITIKPISIRKKFLLVLPYTLFTLFWYVFILLNVKQNDLLSNNSLLLIIGTLIGVLAFTVLSEFIPPLSKSFPQILLITLFFGLILAILIEPEHMILSITHFWQNLVNIYIWGWTWFVIAATLPFILQNNKDQPENQIFVYVFGSYILIVLLLGLFRIPYRLGDTDTSNRLMFQILPVLIFAAASNGSRIKTWFSKPSSDKD